VASPSWCRLLRQEAPNAFSLALANAGRSMAARMAMMAITTKSSISVKARRLFAFIIAFSFIRGRL
jgi:hypothetical protein